MEHSEERRGGRRVPLEAAAEEFCVQSAVPPLIFELAPEDGRKALEGAQESPVFMHPASVSSQEFGCGAWGRIPVYTVRPQNEAPARDVIFYIHGAGWVYGSFRTHEKLVRELAARTNSIVVFPEYSRSPEAKFPVAVEQCWHALSHLSDILGADAAAVRKETLTVAGDSVGGNMAAVMAIRAKRRGGVAVHKQLLFYPVADASFSTESYKEFAENYYLTRDGMQWFWNQYMPAESERGSVEASPLRAGEGGLSGLPPAMIITAQADVLRDEGEAFGEALRRAGTDVSAVRIQGAIHDFVMLNALDQTNACRTAMDIATAWIVRRNG
ncbi:MAG: alpha/beta hydrolase [Treponemataceae bacterium]|nr:alpha/beta hydrolase [Treponemataceae bacterium]